MKLTTMITIAMTLALGAGCGKGGDAGKAKKLAELCVAATDALAKNAEGDDFMQMVQNGLMACSAACDEKDDPSCKTLAGHIEKVCGVSPDVCSSLCSSVKSASLKQATCDFKKP